MKPVVSVIIPTKDRYFYLKKVLSLFNNFGKEDLEIVVQDNSANNDEIVSFIKNNITVPVVYNHTKEWLCVRDNIDRAISLSSGDYVCVIGDDDGVLPNIVECAKWMKKNNIEALKTEVLRYIWPDYAMGAKFYGTLRCSRSSKLDGHYTFLDPLSELNKCISTGFVNRGKMPVVYQGIVSRRVLDEIYEIGGHYSPGPSPDIAEAVAISLTARNYCYLDYPVIISGASAMNGGGIRKLKDQSADVDEVKFLPIGTKDEWEERIPCIWTEQTIWPESAIKALRYMGRADLVEKVNYTNMLCNYVYNHPSRINFALKYAQSRCGFLFVYISYSIRRKIRTLCQNSFGNFVRKPIIKIDNVGDIETACQMLCEKYSVFPL